MADDFENGRSHHPITNSGSALGRGPGAVSAASWPPAASQGGANAATVRGPLCGWARTGQSAETERDRHQGVDPSHAPQAAAWGEAAGRHHDGTGAAAEE